MTTLERYQAHMEGEEPMEPIDQLRYFLALALTGADWIDVEQFIDGVVLQYEDMKAQRDRAIDTCAVRENEIIRLEQHLDTISDSRDGFKQTWIDEVQSHCGTVTIASHLDQQLAVSMAQNLLMRDLLGTFRDDVLFQIGTESPYRKNVVAPYYERVKDVLSATVALGDCIICKADPVAIVNEDDDNKWADILPDRDIRYNTFLYVAVDRPKT